MRLLSNNKIDSDNTTVNNESTAFPKANMLSNILVEKTYFDEYIDIDFGSAESITAIGISSEDLEDLVIMGNSTASWTDPSYYTTMTSNVKFISESYRYWRILKGDSTLDYSTGTDQNLDSPDDAYWTPDNFVFGDNTPATNPVRLNVGDYIWNQVFSSSVGTEVKWNGNNTGTTYGAIKFDSYSEDWQSFASSTYNGLKTFTLPKSADYDSLGGYFQYYYDSDAFTYAFLNNQADIVIAQNGSVYKESISFLNLVVRFDGRTGPAGSATPDIEDQTGFINYVYLGEYLQLAGRTQGSTPTHNTTDVISRTSGHQIYTTRGIIYKTQAFEFPSTTKTEYNTFLTWWESDDRANNLYLVQAEESMTDFPAIYCKIMNFTPEARESEGNSYNWSFEIEEAK